MSVVVTISPLSTVETIFREQSVASMPVELSLVGFAGSFLWFTCGIMLHDWWILAPNAIGILIGCFTTYLIWKFGTFFEDLGKQVSRALTFGPQDSLAQAKKRQLQQLSRLQQLGVPSRKHKFIV